MTGLYTIVTSGFFARFERLPEKNYKMFKIRDDRSLHSIVTSGYFARFERLPDMTKTWKK